MNRQGVKSRPLYPRVVMSIKEDITKCKTRIKYYRHLAYIHEKKLLALNQKLTLKIRLFERRN